MKIKKIIKEIPILPTTALIFYLFVVLFWKINLIPQPAEIINFLESLHIKYGLLGLGIASFLEGIVYLGIYFPGSFIVALAVFLSDGTFKSLILISIIVAITLTITSFINYFLGKHISFKKNKEFSKKLSKSFFLSMLHPNLLAFYFFNSGLERKGLWKIIFVPIIMIPYGFILGVLLYNISDFAKQKIEEPLTMFILIMLWLIIAFIIEHKRKIKKLIIK